MPLSRSTRWLAVALLVAVPVGMATTVHATDSTTETRRIRAHFDSVLTELATRDDRALTTEQHARRAALVAELRRYRDRGVFPHNYDFPGQAVPYFVDRKTGTLCAVANLLDKTGRRDIVDRVAASNNNVWVAELSPDTAFTAWLSDNGLTLDEAARIQVPYAQPVNKAEVARQVAFGVTAPLAVIGAMTTTIWNSTGNADGHHRGWSLIGMGAGAASLAAGSVVMMKSGQLGGDFGTFGAIGMGAGALSMLTSAHAMYRHSDIVSAEREAAQRRVAAEASIGPVVTPNGGAGVGMTIRF